MSFFALNLVLALIWLFLTGSFTLPNLLFGLLIGFVAIALARPYLDSGGYLRSVRGGFRFVRRFGQEVLVANLQLARDLLRVQMPFVPGIVAFETEGLSPAEVVVLANMISLTPGTLAIDTDEAGRIIYIHSLYAGDREALLESFQRLASLVKGVKDPQRATIGRAV